MPAEDPAVYEMLSRANSSGVFQVESRAQMTMLPRLKPQCFYDLVIEVAIVRPGPIQGDMVHPYLRRRCGEEPVDYPSDALKGVLEKTLGVPLVPGAGDADRDRRRGLHASESDRLRRAMATFKRVGTIHTFRSKFIDGMVANGYAAEFAERCFQQIEGFGTYGFPESHAASFALLVYVSSWLKCHYPEVFACALLNSQPMGFYAPAQIVRDARDHGVTVLPVDVNASAWDCTLEAAAPRPGSPRAPHPDPPPQGAHGKTPWPAPALPVKGRGKALGPAVGDKPSPVEGGGRGWGWSRARALRLGFRQVKGLQGGGDGAAGRAARPGLRRSRRSAPRAGVSAARARPPGARRCLRLARARPARRLVARDRPRSHRPRAGSAAPVRLGRRAGRRAPSRRSRCRR